MCLPRSLHAWRSRPTSWDRSPAKFTDRTILSIAKTLIIMQTLTIPPRRAVIGAKWIQNFFWKKFLIIPGQNIIIRRSPTKVREHDEICKTPYINIDRLRKMCARSSSVPFSRRHGISELFQAGRCWGAKAWVTGSCRR